MLRSVLVAIFPAAMLASGVFANAQSTVAWNGVASSGSWTGPHIRQTSMQQQPQTTSHQNSASAVTATRHVANFGSTHHDRGMHHHRHHHHRNANVPWWSRSVYINAGMASDYLATPTPTPTPKTNNITQPGVEVFKSIGN